ncbi:tetratricopeptide repeat protein [Clostridium novyi]|uniref:tetratricopeptide repeat protein n=1 Tax=Clostridium novyi TaxID=1542 RepID=UPI0004D3B13D|nr:tetratricopeptide repeat protein [Clostridium novyi]KEH95543.1 hypothetical protein Z964_04925 [Clostridium novyi A str. GD211209]
MKRKNIISLIVIFMIILSFSGCANESKGNVVTSDVKKEAKLKDDKIKSYIEEGSKLLGEKKFDEAKSAFQKAISEDKSNKDTYIKIKDKYMENQRMDDAYQIINLAVKNNVDTENMKKLSSDIKSKFEVSIIEQKAYEYGKYSLPSSVKIKINNEEKQVNVVWNNPKVDTTKVKVKKYTGKAQGYDREVQLNLSILPVKTVKKTVYAMGTYIKNNRRYLKTREVEFFRDTDEDMDIAERMAIQDGHADYLIDGRVDDDYYIRDLNKPMKVYEMAPNASISVCEYMVNSSGSAGQNKINYERFSKLNNGKYNQILSYIFLKNGIIVKYEQQYLP